MPWFGWDEETRAISHRAARRDARKRARKTATPDLARNLTIARREAPWVPPTALVGLVQSGHGPDDPAFRQVAAATFFDKARTGQWALPGEETEGEPAARAVKAGKSGEKIRRDSQVESLTAPPPPDQENPADAAQFWLIRRGQAIGYKKAKREIKDAIIALEHGVPRPAAGDFDPDDPDAPIVAIMEKLVAAQGSRSFSLGSTDKGANEFAVFVQAATNSKGLDRRIEDFTQAEQTRESVENFDWGAWTTGPLLGAYGEAVGAPLEALGAPEGTARGISRGFMLAAQYPMDIVNASLRSVASGTSAMSYDGTKGVVGNLVSALNPFEGEDVDRYKSLNAQSAGGQALADLVSGREVDTGAGWLPDLESGTWKRAAQEARDASPGLIGDSAWTPGRYIANQIADPDSAGFTIASGLVDAAITIKADPTNPLFNAYTDAVRTGRTLDLGDDVTQAAFSAGLARRQAERAFTKAERAAKRAEIRQAEIPMQGSVFDLNYAHEQNAIDAALRGRDEAQAALDAAKGAHDEALAAAYEAAGAYPKGHRLTRSPQKVNAYLSGADGQRVVDFSVGVTSPTESWMKWNRKGPIAMHREIADAATPEEVKGVIMHYVGTGGVREIPNQANFKYGLHPMESRWAQQTPSAPVFEFADLDSRVLQADRFLRNADVAPDVRREVLDQVARADSWTEYKTAISDGVYGAVRDRLIDDGLGPNAAKALTDWAGSHTLQRAYFNDMTSGTGEVVETPWIVLNGNGEKIPSPHLSTEGLARGIPIVDYKAIRRATRVTRKSSKELKELARYSRERAATLAGKRPVDARGHEALADAMEAMADDKAMKFAADADLEVSGLASLERGLEKAVSKYGDWWRRSKLVRIAWGVRVVGEEQARMWAYGYGGAIAHPFRAIAILAGSEPDGKLARLLKRFGADPKYATDVNGARFLDDAIGEALNSPPRFGNIYDRVGGPNSWDSIGIENWEVIGAEHHKFTRALGEEMVRMSRAPEVRAAIDMTPADLKVWFQEDPTGQAIWKRVAADDRLAHAGLLEEGAEVKAFGEMSVAEQEAVLDAHVQTIYDRIDQFTGGHEAVRRAIADRKIGDTYLPGVIDHAKRADRDLLDMVKGLREEGWQGPVKIRARSDLFVTNAREAARNHELGQAFDTLMWNLMPRQSNYLSRSPLFREAYWNRTAEMIGATSPEVKAQIIDAARNAGVSDDLIAKMSLVVPIADGPAISKSTIDHLAKAHGLSETRRILYDLAERGQFFDMFRQVFPFGEAWKEVLTRWSRALVENPKIVHRLSQGISAGRGEGIIHTDPLTGQEVVTYPGTEWITDRLLGAPVPFQGSLQGVNIAAQGLPGVGPAVSIPLPHLARLLDWNLNDPKNRTWTELIYPYGQPEPSDIYTQVSESLLPTWLGKMIGATAQVPDQTQRSTVNYLMNYLASTGDYDLHGDLAHEEMRRLVDDAGSKARWLNLFRGALSGTAPSAPIPKWLIRDPDNKLQELQVIRSKYQEKAQDDPDGAFDWLIENFGQDNYLIAQSFSRTHAVTPRTRDGWDFVGSNPWLEREFPETFGLIVPENKDGKFDITGYWQYRNANEIADLEPEDRVKMANDRVAKWIYDGAAAGFGPNPSDEEIVILDAIRDDLLADFPGYQDSSPDFNSIPRRIREIDRMVNDPRVLKNEQTGSTAKAVREYLDLREAVLEMQRGVGLTARSVSSSKKALEFRLMLRGMAESLIEQDEGFAAFWNNVFRREIKDY